MKIRMKAAFIAAALLCIVIAAFVYTRPLTIEQRYPVLDLSQCTLIRGYFFEYQGALGPDSKTIQFTIAPDDPQFDEMIELLRSTAFETSLRNILPRGTKHHEYQDGDFEWMVTFQFEDVLFPNEDIVGEVVRIHNDCGDVALCFQGEDVECSVKNQAQWVKDVMSIVTQYTD